jgi:hypothetical protein
MITKLIDVGNEKEWQLCNWELVIPKDSMLHMTPQEIGELVIHLNGMIDRMREEYDEREHAEIGRSFRYTRERPFYKALVERDGERCSIPGCDLTPLDIDHIHPKSKGGTDSLDNLQLLCSYHNGRKSNKDWETFKREHINDEVKS